MYRGSLNDDSVQYVCVAQNDEPESLFKSLNYESVKSFWVL